MTIDEILKADTAYLSPSDICELTGYDAYALRFHAKNSPDELPFPVTVIGSSVKIPRIPFLICYPGEKTVGKGEIQ